MAPATIAVTAAAPAQNLALGKVDPVVKTIFGPQ
jgi:hypothetical protein